MADEAQVKVEKGAYRIQGEFHTLTPNQPIRREDGKLCGVTNPRYMVYMHSYGGEAPFFAGLAEGKLLGTRCDNPDCEYKGTVRLPFLIHCPDCLKKSAIVDLTQTVRDKAKVHSYIETSRTGAFNTLDTPIKFIDIEMEGVDTMLKSYLLAGDPKIGTEVVPVFRTKDPTYTITDLAFVEKGTKEEDLPEGFTF